MPTIDAVIAELADSDFVIPSYPDYWVLAGGFVSIGDGYHSYYQYSSGGLRYRGINIPAGAIITTAYLTFKCDAEWATGNTMKTTLACELTKNPGQITSYVDHQRRTRSIKVNWNGIEPWYVGNTYQSISFAVCLQDVVDTCGGTGDALIVFFEDNNSDPGASRVYGGYGYFPPLLHIEYNMPPPSTIAATAGIGGTITPSGAVSVVYGGNQGFVITPDPDYSIASLVVDGMPVVPLGGYTFVNVIADHTIVASFTPNVIAGRTCKVQTLPASSTPGIVRQYAGRDY